MNWKWYEWNSLNEFNEWHERLKTKLNYPLIGFNQATGEPDANACLTTEYTGVSKVNDKFVGIVEDSEAEGLTPTDIRPPKPKGFEN